MTECERYQELISRMTDDELTKSERAALSAHIEHCSQCSAMYAVFSDLSEIIGQDAEPLPEGLHENIMADIRRSAIKQRSATERRRFIIPRQYRNVLAAAACAAVVIFAAKGMLTEKISETSAMSASEAASVAEPSPSAAATPQPTPAIPPKTPTPDVTAAPSASPEARSSGTDDDKYSGSSAADNSNNSKTGSTSSSQGGSRAAAPASTQAPSQALPEAETEKPRAVATPAPTPAATAAPETSAQSVPEESSAPAAAASEPEAVEEPEESEEPAGRFRSFFMQNEPVAAAEAPDDDAVVSAVTADDDDVSVQSADGDEAAVADNSSKVVFAEIKTASKRGELMRLLKGIDESPAPTESAKPEKPAETASPTPAPTESVKPEKPTETASPSPSPSEAVSAESLPAQDPDFMYQVLFPQSKDEEDFMSVCIFGEDVYWVVFSDDGSEQVFRAECSAKEFEDFIKPFIITEASPSPEASAEAQETPRPVQ